MAGLGGTGGKSRAYSRVPRAVPEETGENRARIHGCERKAWDAVHTIQRLNSGDKLGEASVCCHEP